MTAVRLDARHCSYQCPHFQMGAPSARCNKYDEAVAFSRHGKPRLMPECAAEAEREACARLCDAEARKWDSDDVVTEKNYAAHCANIIRARGNE